MISTHDLKFSSNDVLSVNFLKFHGIYSGVWRVKNVFLKYQSCYNVFRCRSIRIPEFGRIYNKGGGPRIFKVKNFSKALLGYVRVFLKLLDLKSLLKSSERGH